MLTAAKLVLPALAAALFVWGAAWCVVRTLRPQMADTAAVGGERPPPGMAKAGGQAPEPGDPDALLQPAEPGASL